MKRMTAEELDATAFCLEELKRSRIGFAPNDRSKVENFDITPRAEGSRECLGQYAQKELDIAIRNA